MCIYIYLENHKDNFFYPYGFGHSFCPLRFFPNTAMSGCKPILTGQSFSWHLGFVGQVPTVWVCRLETVFGAVCWHLLTAVFFQHDVEKIQYSISLYFIGTSKFGGKYGSICGQIWVLYRDSQFAPLRAEIPLLKTVRGSPSPVLSKDLNNPSKSKNKIHNSAEKHPLQVKPIMDKQNCPYGFPGVYIYIANCKCPIDTKKDPMPLCLIEKKHGGPGSTYFQT